MTDATIAITPPIRLRDLFDQLDSCVDDVNQCSVLLGRVTPDDIAWASVHYLISQLKRHGADLEEALEMLQERIVAEGGDQ